MNMPTMTPERISMRVWVASVALASIAGVGLTAAMESPEASAMPSVTVSAAEAEAEARLAAETYPLAVQDAISDYCVSANSDALATLDSAGLTTDDGDYAGDCAPVMRSLGYDDAAA